VYFLIIYVDLFSSFFRLADFFKYYSRDFPYNTAVVSIRAGAMMKEAKGWQGAVSDAISDVVSST
jgi:hypothetical protein